MSIDGHGNWSGYKSEATLSVTVISNNWSSRKIKIISGPASLTMVALRVLWLVKFLWIETLEQGAKYVQS